MFQIVVHSLLHIWQVPIICAGLFYWGKVVACGQTCSSCYALFLPQQGQVCDDDILIMQIEYVSLRCQLKDTYVGNIGFSKSICLDS